MVAVVLVVAACSAEGGSPSPTLPLPTTTTTLETTTTTVVSTEATDAFRSCMADEGVDVDPFVFDAHGRPRLDLALIGVNLAEGPSAEALAICSELLSSGALDLSGVPVLRGEVQRLLQEFSECVRSQGVDSFPDPVPEFHGVGGPFPVSEIPYGDPDLEEAVGVCGARLAA